MENIILLSINKIFISKIINFYYQKNKIYHFLKSIFFIKLMIFTHFLLKDSYGTVDPSQTEDHGVRSLPQVYLSAGGVHSCFTWRHALLQVAHNLEQYANEEKAKHGEGHMPLTNVGNSTSPNGSGFCRPRPMIYGEDFLEPAPKASSFRRCISTPPGSYSK